MQKRFYLFVVMLALSITGWATSLLESPSISANLPSEETAEEIKTISELNISLRQAPDEDGFAQKEVPLGNVDTSVFLLLAGGIFAYILHKHFGKNKTRGKMALLPLILTLASAQQLNAQLVFSANPDNAFVKPNANDFTPIDVLFNDYYVLNLSDDCTRSGLEIKLWDSSTSSFTSDAVNGTLGRARVSDDNQVEYRPRANQYGADKITYQIRCPKSGKTAQANIYINVNDRPNMISDANCYIDPVGITFHMKELARSPLNNVWNAGTPLVGDVDNDGNVEMFVKDHTSPIIRAFRFNKSSSILTELSDYTITLTAGNGYASAPFVLAKVNGSQKASIFTVSGNLLLKYDINAAGKYVETARVTMTGGNPSYINVSPIVVDIMGSGRTQVCVFDEVYDTKTLKLIAKGNMLPATSINYTYSFGRLGAGTSFESALVPGDIDGDGILELVGGDCVYKVNITDFDNKAATNTFTLFKRASKTNHPNIGDGATALVDIDLDGQLEVAVSGPLSNGYLTSDQCIIYVYNPRTGAVMHTNNQQFTRFKKTQGPSRIFAGDIDGDGYPEICLTSHHILLAFQMDDDNGNKTTTLNRKWSYVINDESSSTTLSMFDFTQEGKARLVYRDQTHLRIIDGSGSAAIQEPGSFTPIGSVTANEFPIVADINGDGAAEIIVTGNLDGGFNSIGYLRVFGADTSKGKLWAPARKVWNQATYNPLFVNDDLTIPARPISPSTAFVSPNGKENRPFNNLLQQSTSLNKEGTMIMLGPDLIFDPRVPKRLVYDSADNLNVSVGILNEGDAIFTGPIRLQLYAYNSTTDIYTPVGNPYSFPNASGLSHIAPNNTTDITYTIPNISSELPAIYNNLVMTVNLNSNPKHTPIFAGSTECLEGRNNFASGFSLVNGERVMCEGETETVSLEGVGSYTVKWYTTATGGLPINTNTSMNVTKDNTPVTYYFVECYETSSSPTPITNVRDTVFVYLAPDSLVWTGKGNTADWHDWQNWKDPSETLAAKACVPRKCTNVQLPANINIYPNLNNTSGTTYSRYSSSECNNIHFSHGGELVRPDMLTYSKAFVDVTFQSHRWHLFAPPLKDFYTGDLYINDIIPANDIIKSYTKYWARRNPWTNAYQQDWNGLFHQPNESFSAGQAMGVWISDKSISGQVSPPRDPFDFAFPKNETEYYVYVEDTTYPSDDPKNPYQTPRVDNYRFIFDGTTAGTNFSLKIDGESITAGQMVLVGNPFMAHLDFDKFYAANSTLIQNYYIIMDENSVQQHYNKNGSSSLTKNIAPMQAFLVEVKAPFTNLLANGTMTLSVPGDKMKSALGNNLADDGFSLKVTATQEEMTHATFISFTEDHNDEYIAGEDIAGIFPSKISSDTRSIVLYSQTSDGMKTSLNNLSMNNLQNKEIPLGLWSPKKASSNLTLNVSNLNLLPSGYAAFLYDKLNDKSFDLSSNSMYEFETGSPDNNHFIDNRFYLKFAFVGASIENNNPDDGIIITSNHGLLTISAMSKIEQLEVYTVQGRLVIGTKVNSTTFETALPDKGIYIVKININDKTVVKKILATN